MVPEKNDVGLETEFLNVTKWANENKLMINMAKTKELIFHRPNARNYLPPELPCIERVICAKLLGVWLQDDLGTTKHTEYIMHICNQRAYLLTLWTPGAGIPVLRKLQNDAKHRYTGSAQISLHRQTPVYRVCVNI